MRDAHGAGLKVVPYTVRAENQFLPAQYRKGTNPNDYGNAFGEFADLCRVGVDGLFSDNPDIAYTARADALGRPGGVAYPTARVK